MARFFDALGNDHPQILVQLEDCVLEAIFAISQEKPHEEAMQSLHTQILLLMEDLGKDHDGLTWFNLSTGTSINGSTPPLPEPPSTPAAAGIHNHLSDQFLSQWPLLNTWELLSKIHFISSLLQIHAIIPQSSPLVHPPPYKGKTHLHHNALTLDIYMTPLLQSHSLQPVMMIK